MYSFKCELKTDSSRWKEGMARRSRAQTSQARAALMAAPREEGAE